MSEQYPKKNCFVILKVQTMKIYKFFLILGLFFTGLLPLSMKASAAPVAINTVAGELNYSANCEVPPGVELDGENCGIVAYLVLAINVLSAAAGLAIVASIMLAGYQYMTARDNAGQIESARKRIVWALVALGIFIFMYAGLNFVVPGGVL